MPRRSLPSDPVGLVLDADLAGFGLTSGTLPLANTSKKLVRASTKTTCRARRAPGRSGRPIATTAASYADLVGQPVVDSATERPVRDASRNRCDRPPPPHPYNANNNC